MGTNLLSVQTSSIYIYIYMLIYVYVPRCILVKEHPVSLSNVIRLKVLSLMKVFSEHNSGLRNNKTNFFSYGKIPPCFLFVLREKLKEKRFVCNKCEIILN